MWKPVSAQHDFGRSPSSLYYPLSRFFRHPVVLVSSATFRKRPVREKKLEERAIIYYFLAKIKCQRTIRISPDLGLPGVVGNAAYLIPREGKRLEYHSRSGQERRGGRRRIGWLRGHEFDSSPEEGSGRDHRQGPCGPRSKRRKAGKVLEESLFTAATSHRYY